MAKVRGVLVSTHAGVGVDEVTIEDVLDEYYRILECDLIDCTVRRIGKKEYDIVCDDEGLFREDVKVTAFTNGLMPALVGNLFICNHDDEGNWTSLTDEEVNEIKQNTLMVFDGGNLREVIQVWA